MAYERKNRLDKTKIIFLCLLSGLIVIAGIILINYTKHTIPVSTDNEISVKTSASEINILRAARNIEAGEKADASKFEMISISRELAAAGVVTSMAELQEQRLKTNLVRGEFLLQSHLVNSSAWYEDGDRLIEHTFQLGAIPVTVKVGSSVDIKLFREKAEDTVVVSKAVVVGIRENTLSFYLNEMEQEFIKEANTEGLLFLVQYLDDMQPASSITYRPGYKQTAAKSTGIGKEEFANSSMNKD